ncbi:response regulator [Deltaproteobacteria bacterium TL4]
MARIFIIDDDNHVVEQLSVLLSAFGYELAHTLYSTAAFEYLKVKPADLILLDVNMPEMDGITLLKQLKAHPVYRSIPVIMLTGEMGRELLKECFDLGAIDYINKPLDEVILQTRIKSALTIQQSIKELTHSKAELQESLNIQQLLNDNLITATTELRAAQQQLIHAQKMKALGTLAGGIAHDFNNILFAMLGYSELLLDRYAQDTESAGYIKNIIQSGNRAKNVVRQLLNFARFEEKVHTPTQLIPTIKDALEMMRITLPSNIEIRQQIHPKCPSILADASQIYQILLNLCTNASEAMKEKGGILEVIAEPLVFEISSAHLDEMPPGTYLHLLIRDTGIGIETEIQDQIFDPFFTTKGLGGTHLGASKDGTGLGLSVVYNIVQNHNGRINLESKLNQGTTFHLYFPALAADVEAVKAATPERLFRSKLISPPKIHILVAEDELLLAQLYTEALEQQGYRITLCKNGEEALTTFRNYPDQFDLVLTDQAMPKLTGTQLSQELIKIRPELPIILVTGYSTIVAEESYKAFGIRKFLMKPLDSDTLFRTIQSIFDVSA